MTSEYDKAQERYHECIKDLDPTLHVGGFPARAIVIEPVDGYWIEILTREAEDLQKLIRLFETREVQ
jgi:hypothetical protein